ncbi:Zf-rvt domain-containing protein [Thalictrum thalictroides]|uniref:Zf-rvt domain-containing protein n=1 Tax=Thalictrum thalictroides TaxID=46969 RepID=A0A7J6V3Q1_THATH|nr:Zf-rvt domain-containing protein [Thalictrum thalictroides]
MEAQSLADLCGIKLVKAPVTYLGLPLIAGRLIVKDCQPIIEIATRRITTWKARNLTYVGRLQLVESVISAFQVYWAKTYMLQKTVAEQLSQLFAKVLWSGLGLENKLDASC